MDIVTASLAKLPAGLCWLVDRDGLAMYQGDSVVLRIMKARQGWTIQFNRKRFGGQHPDVAVLNLTRAIAWARRWLREQGRTANGLLAHWPTSAQKDLEDIQLGPQHLVARGLAPSGPNSALQRALTAKRGPSMPYVYQQGTEILIARI